MTGLNTKNNYSCTMKYVAWKCNGQVAQDKLWRKMSLLTCQTMNLLKVHRTLSAPEDVKSAKFLQIKTRLNWHAGSMMTTAMSCTWTVTLITDVDVSQSPAVDWVQPTTCLNPPEPCRLWPVNSRQLNIISTHKVCCLQRWNLITIHSRHPCNHLTRLSLSNNVMALFRPVCLSNLWQSNQ